MESGPTSSVSKLVSGIQELDIRLEDIEFVAITHVHLDHGGGVGTLLKFLPNAKVIVHSRGMPHLINPERLWLSAQTVLGFVSEIFGKPEPVPEERIIPVTEGMFDLGEGAKLKVIETVGSCFSQPKLSRIFQWWSFSRRCCGYVFSRIWSCGSDYADTVLLGCRFSFFG